MPAEAGALSPALFPAESRLPVRVPSTVAVLVGAGASLMCVVSLAPMASALGTVSIGIWAGTALVGSLQCLLLGELTSRFPMRAGGTAQFGYRAWPRGSATLGALSSWCYWFAWTPGIAVNLVLAATYLHRLGVPIAPLPLAALIGVALYAVVASGLRLVAMAGAVLAAGAILVVVLVIAAPILDREAAHWEVLSSPVSSGEDIGPGSLAKWAFVASWSSYGAETAAAVAAEVRDAPREMGKVMARSGLICLAACALVPLALFLAAPELVGSDALGAITRAARPLLGSASTAVVGAGVTAVLLLGALAFITSSSRTVYQMAEDRYLPSTLAHVNRRGVPTGSIALDAVVIGLMLVAFGTDVVDVVAAANVGYLVVFVLLPCAYLVLRRAHSEHGDGLRLGRWAVPMAWVLALFNLALLGYGGAQWGWRVVALGIAISLVIVPVSAWCRRGAVEAGPR